MTKFPNSITRGFAAGRRAEYCGLPAAGHRNRVRPECRMRALVRHRYSAKQQDRAAARALSANQHGQRRDPSRCVGIPGWAGGAAHAPLRGPARDGAAIADRRISCIRGGGSQARGSRAINFGLNRRPVTVNVSACPSFTLLLPIGVRTGA